MAESRLAFTPNEVEFLTQKTAHFCPTHLCPSKSETSDIGFASLIRVLRQSDPGLDEAETLNVPHVDSLAVSSTR
jgi:hypothetical protein